VFPDVPRATGQLIITESTPRSSKPREMGSGLVRWNGEVYRFDYSHDFDQGITYLIYDENKFQEQAIAYFFLFTGEAAEERAAEQPIREDR
jgi:hypothetical protein